MAEFIKKDLKDAASANESDCKEKECRKESCDKPEWQGANEGKRTEKKHLQEREHLKNK